MLSGISLLSRKVYFRKTHSLRPPLQLSIIQSIVLAHRLKQARLRAGLSQEKLGKLAGIDPMSASARMNQYERGKHSPDFKLMCKVAEILNMPVSWFYTEDEDAARVQEVFFTLSPLDRKTLLDQVERQAQVSAPEQAPVALSTGAAISS